MDESLSSGQKEYFKHSKVRDDQGNLLKVYHGTRSKILSFDPAFTGQGNDQYGSGFYFTTKRDFAESFTTLAHVDKNGQERVKLSGETYPNVVEAYVNIKNPIVINGLKDTNLSNVLIPNKFIYDIVKELPTLYHNINDEFEPNPLGDYVEESWEVNPKTKEEFQPLIKKMVNNYFQNTDLRTLDTLFGKYAEKLRKAINQTMGYDGVIVDFRDNQHIVAWFPEQIKDVKNLEPKISPYLMENHQALLNNRHNRSLTERLNDAHKQLTEQHQEKTIEQKQELSNLSEVINKTENEIRKFHDKKLER